MRPFLIWVLLTLTASSSPAVCSSNTERPTVPQINPAVSLHVFARAVLPMQDAPLFSRGTVLPHYSGQQAPAQGTFPLSLSYSRSQYCVGALHLMYFLHFMCVPILYLFPCSSFSIVGL